MSPVIKFYAQWIPLVGFLYAYALALTNNNQHWSIFVLYQYRTLFWHSFWGGAGIGLLYPEPIYNLLKMVG